MNYWTNFRLIIHRKWTTFRLSNTRARYGEVNQSGLRLLPPKESIPVLREDYKSMQSMIFGESISFEEILNGLTEMLVEMRSEK